MLAWQKDMELAGDTVTEGIICKKAHTVYDELIKVTAGTSMVDGPGELFKANRGWFYGFKKRTGIHSVVGHGEVWSVDVKAAEAFVKFLSSI